MISAAPSPRAFALRQTGYQQIEFAGTFRLSEEVPNPTSTRGRFDARARHREVGRREPVITARSPFGGRR